MDKWITVGSRKVSEINNYTPVCMVCRKIIKNTVWDMKRIVPEGFDSEEIEVGPDCKRKLENGEEVKWKD